MIILRIDVDYAYPSRLKSCLAMKGFWWGEDAQYLKDAKFLAMLINGATNDVKAYWFFTKYTLPDKDLRRLIDNEKHVVGLHVANDPTRELEMLEKKTHLKIDFFTIHGTSHFFTQLLWNRHGQKQATIPQDFSLKSFHEFPTVGLDTICFKRKDIESLSSYLKECVDEGKVLSVHPEWVLRSNLRSRGPCFDVLQKLFTS
jgi:hypothetical protein